jgi:hypothetical protein
VEALKLIGNKDRLIDAVMQKSESVSDAMWLARNIPEQLAMTDPSAYRALCEGAKMMMLRGF